MPFSYLGLQVGANMNLCKNWLPVLEAFRSRLSSWKAKTLSIGGRVTLIKSVLEALPIYYFSLYRAPNQVIQSLEKMMRSFLWGGDENKRKINWLSWEVVTRPKEKGGLGIMPLKVVNLAMLSKWWWRFEMKNTPYGGMLSGVFITTLGVGHHYRYDYLTVGFGGTYTK